jgi:hypothetical protein
MEQWLETFALANFRRSADTAHDLKTPLNVAVLNLELMRMRLRKIQEDEDEKTAGYMRAIELELRRMGQIFDAFFLLSTPPKGYEAPAVFELAPLIADAAEGAGVDLGEIPGGAIRAHESRIRQALELFFEGSARLFTADGASAAAFPDGANYIVSTTGRPAASEFEPTRVFKFYYTDAEGNPDLALAAARLIAETYGGGLEATDDRDKVSLRLSFPLGER